MFTFLLPGAVGLLTLGFTGTLHPVAEQNAMNVEDRSSTTEESGAGERDS